MIKDIGAYIYHNTLLQLIDQNTRICNITELLNMLKRWNIFI